MVSQIIYIYIYHGPPKPTFLQVFMVNNLVFRWPKPLFFMVLGAHGVYIYIYICMYIICTIAYAPYGKKNYTNQQLFFSSNIAIFCTSSLIYCKKSCFLGIHLCCVLEVVEAPHRTKHPPPKCRVEPGGSVVGQMVWNNFTKTIRFPRKFGRAPVFDPSSPFESGVFGRYNLTIDD